MSSDSNGQAVLHNESSKSRMEVIEVPDLTEQEAWEYWNFTLGGEVVEKNRKELLYAFESVTGGRVLYLKKISSTIEQGLSLPDVFENILSDAREDFRKAGMFYPMDARYSVFWEVADKLLSNKTIPDYEVCNRMSQDVYLKLRQTNIFSYHHIAGFIGFQSVAHKTIAKTMKPILDGMKNIKE